MRILYGARLMFEFISIPDRGYKDSSSENMLHTYFPFLLTSCKGLRRSLESDHSLAIRS